MNGLNMLFGMNVIEAPVRMEPALKLRDDCPCSDEMRAAFNSWLVEMFGMREISAVPKGIAYMFGNNIVMRPESIAMTKNITA